MGWTFHNGRPRDEKAEVLRILEPLDVRYLRKIGSVWYGAATDSTLGHTFGVVILTKVSQGDWGYKGIDESMGPNASNAPKKMIDMLSPTDSPYANAWRQRCLDTARRPGTPVS